MAKNTINTKEINQLLSSKKKGDLRKVAQILTIKLLYFRNN